VIFRQPPAIAPLAVPMVIQLYRNAGIAYGLNRALGVALAVACPPALIGASNFFELAVAGGRRAVRISVRRGAGDGGGSV
jgi:arsenite transporter